MKTRYSIMFALAAVLSFSSCEKDRYDGHLRNANLFVNLEVSSGVDTKTAGSDEDSAGDKEKKISSVKLYLVKWDSTAEAPDATAAVTEITSTKLGSNSVEASVTSTNGNYQLLYVLANCPSTLTVSTTNYASFIGSYSQSAANVGNIWTDNKFFMVNSVDDNKTTTGTDAVTCYNGGVLVDFSNQSNTVSVCMERMAAKIVADQDRYIDFAASLQKVIGEDDENGFVISSAKIDAWALLNCVNSFNLMQKYNKDTKDFHKNASGNLMDVIVTPSSNDQGTDPYPVAKKSSSGSFIASTGYYFTNPGFTGFNATTKIPEYTELKFVDAGDSLYCLENNPPYYPTDSYTKNNGAVATPAVSDSKMKGRSTAVIFRAQILLADGFDAGSNTGSGGGASGGTDPLVEDPNKGNWDNPPTKAYDNKIVKTIYAYKGKYYADETYMKTLNTNLSSCSTPDDYRSKGVKVYENGYMYFTYYIAKTEVPGCHSPYYCVERNKCYRLTVKGVSGLGDDLPCDFTNYDPEDPVDMAIPRLKVTVDVLPWNVKDPVTYEIQ